VSLNLSGNAPLAARQHEQLGARSARRGQRAAGAALLSQRHEEQPAGVFEQFSAARVVAAPSSDVHQWKWFQLLCQQLAELQMKLPDVNDTVCFTSDSNMAMAEYLRKPSGKCLFHAQEVPVATAVIIVLFAAVMSTGLIGLTRTLCCTQPAPTAAGGSATWVALS